MVVNLKTFTQNWGTQHNASKVVVTYEFVIHQLPNSGNVLQHWQFQATFLIFLFLHFAQCDQKKSPNVYKSCPKMISLQKWMFLQHLLKLPNNEGNLGKIIVATGFECLHKKQKIAQSGHSDFTLSFSSSELASLILWQASVSAYEYE